MLSVFLNHSMLLFESGLSLNLEPISWLGRLTHKPQECAASDLPALGLPRMLLNLVFMWVLEIPTQILRDAHKHFTS